MTAQSHDMQASGERGLGLRNLLDAAGCRYWTASLLPALVGTTLPFWLRPTGFSFRWPAAVWFLLATTLLHAGFSFLHARFERGRAVAWPGSWLVALAGACIAAGGLLGLYLNAGLTFHAGVPTGIFVVYGLCVVFTGVLYVVPPFSFCRRLGGETVLCVALGLLPVLGAYLVQAGDLTRRVYLASTPLVVATALWLWVEELMTMPADEKEGRQTMVIVVGPRLSRRFGVLALSLLLLATLLVAVLSSAIAPWALATFVTVGLLRTVVLVAWREHGEAAGLSTARSRAFAVHLVTGIIMAAASLTATNGARSSPVSLRVGPQTSRLTTQDSPDSSRSNRIVSLDTESTCVGRTPAWTPAARSALSKEARR